MPITYMCDRCGATLDRVDAKKLIWFGGELLGVYCGECKEKVTAIIEGVNIQ